MAAGSFANRMQTRRVGEGHHEKKIKKASMSHNTSGEDTDALE
jgi:hypothetical protein